MESKNTDTQKNSNCKSKDYRRLRPIDFGLLLTPEEMELFRCEIKKSGLTITDFMLSLAGARPLIARYNCGTSIAILRELKNKLSDMLDFMTAEPDADPEILRYAGRVLNKAEMLEKRIWNAYAVGGSNEPRKKQTRVVSLCRE
ncbi:MAG: hypothetical protein LUD29_04535 [Clostridia bacterium]|nr:hypothetical protein [Clostridia bacterium]